MRALISAFQWFLMGLVLTPLGSVFLLISIFDRRGDLLYPIQKFYLGICLLIIGVRLRTEGREHVPPEGAVVFMPNHRSWWDIPAMLISAWPRRVRFVAKRQVSRIPLLGWCALQAGHIFIDREDREAAIRTLKAVARRFSGEFSLVLFPEGTRAPDHRLVRFKRGGFHLAKQLGIQIVPVSISGSQEVMSRHTWSIRPGTVTVRFHPPVDPAAFADVDDAVTAVHDAVAAGLEDGGRNDIVTNAG